MATMNISAMRDWLMNMDPQYGGNRGWITKVKNFSDNQIIAVYHSRQAAIAKANAKILVKEDANKGLPTLVEDKIPQREMYHQMTLMDVFGDTMKEGL